MAHYQVTSTSLTPSRPAPAAPIRRGNDIQNVLSSSGYASSFSVGTSSPSGSSYASTYSGIGGSPNRNSDMVSSSHIVRSGMVAIKEDGIVSWLWRPKWLVLKEQTLSIHKNEVSRRPAPAVVASRPVSTPLPVSFRRVAGGAHGPSATIDELVPVLAKAPIRVLTSTRHFLLSAGLFQDLRYRRAEAWRTSNHCGDRGWLSLQTREVVTGAVLLYPIAISFHTSRIWHRSPVSTVLLAILRSCPAGRLSKLRRPLYVSFQRS